MHTRTRYLILALVLALPLLFLGAYFLTQSLDTADVNTQNGEVPTQATGTPGGTAAGDEFLGNRASCSTTDPDVLRVISGPYREIDSRAAGTVTARGQIVTREQSVFGTPVTAVYLVVASSSPPLFRSNNLERVGRDNTINRIEDGQLFYKLGTLRNGEFVSSANVSERARARILEANRTGGTTALTLQVPLYEGSGAPADFTFACAIIAAE